VLRRGYIAVCFDIFTLLRKSLEKVTIGGSSEEQACKSTALQVKPAAVQQESSDAPKGGCTAKNFGEDS